MDSLHVLNPVHERFFPHEVSFPPFYLHFRMNPISKGAFSNEINVDFHHEC